MVGVHFSGPASVTKGSKNAHSALHSCPRITADLLHEDQRRITPHRVGGIRLVHFVHAAWSVKGAVRCTIVARMTVQISCGGGLNMARGSTVTAVTIGSLRQSYLNFATGSRSL